MSSNENLTKLAKRAYYNFLVCYSVLQPKNVYDVHTIVPKDFSKNFGLKIPPEFDYSRIPFSHFQRDNVRKPKRKQQSSESTKAAKKPKTDVSINSEDKKEITLDKKGPTHFNPKKNKKHRNKRAEKGKKKHSLNNKGKNSKHFVLKGKKRMVFRDKSGKVFVKKDKKVSKAVNTEEKKAQGNS